LILLTIDDKKQLSVSRKFNMS